MSTRLVTSIPSLLAAAIAPPRDTWTPTITWPASPSAAGPALADLGLPRLTFTVTPRRVRGVPLTTKAGRYLLTVVGDPSVTGAPGGAMLIQLPPGISLDAAMDAAERAGATAPPFYLHSILPGGASIGADGTAVSVIDLTPGEWLVAGYGMTTEPTTMTVTGAMPDRLTEPNADIAIDLHDAGIALRGSRPRAGRRIVRIDNSGRAPRAVTLLRVPRGATAATLPATLARPGAAVPVTSTIDQSAGTSMWLSVDLAPGTYAALGDGPIPASGAPGSTIAVFTASQE